MAREGYPMRSEHDFKSSLYNALAFAPSVKLAILAFDTIIANCLPVSNL
jgi:hypothetical protein